MWHWKQGTKIKVGHLKKKVVDCRDCILSENWDGLFDDITADQLMYIGLGFQHTDFL